MSKVPVEILAMTITCPNKKHIEEITIPLDNISFSSDESECDVCGSHGTIKCSFKCFCPTTSV